MISSSRSRSSRPTYRQAGFPCSVTTPVGVVRTITCRAEPRPTRCLRAAWVNRINTQPIMSDTSSFVAQYSDTVPDTPPSSGITADRSYGTLGARVDLGERRLFEAGCTVPGDDRLSEQSQEPPAGSVVGSVPRISDLLLRLAPGRADLQRAASVIRLDLDGLLRNAWDRAMKAAARSAACSGWDVTVVECIECLSCVSGVLVSSRGGGRCGTVPEWGTGARR